MDVDIQVANRDPTEAEANYDLQEITSLLEAENKISATL